MPFENEIIVPILPNGKPGPSILVHMNVNLIAIWHPTTMPSRIEGLTNECVVVVISGAGSFVVPMNEADFLDELATAGLTATIN